MRALRRRPKTATFGRMQKATVLIIVEVSVLIAFLSRVVSVEHVHAIASAFSHHYAHPTIDDHEFLFINDPLECVFNHE